MPSEPIRQAEETLYTIPVLILQESPYFASLLESAHLGGKSEGQRDSDPIILHELSLTKYYLSRRVKDSLKLTVERWSAALHLATLWDFVDVRLYCIDRIHMSYPDQNAFDRMDLAVKCHVDEWLAPAYATMCSRAEPFEPWEMERLGFARLAAVCRIRERWNSVRKVSVACKTCIKCKCGYHSAITGARDAKSAVLDMVNASVELCGMKALSCVEPLEPF